MAAEARVPIPIQTSMDAQPLILRYGSKYPMISMNPAKRLSRHINVAPPYAQSAPVNRPIPENKATKPIPPMISQPNIRGDARINQESMNPKMPTIMVKIPAIATPVGLPTSAVVVSVIILILRNRMTYCCSVNSARYLPGGRSPKFFFNVSFERAFAETKS
jgi:hypothetical protein